MYFVVFVTKDNEKLIPKTVMYINTQFLLNYKKTQKNVLES